VKDSTGVAPVAEDNIAVAGQVAGTALEGNTAAVVAVAVRADIELQMQLRVDSCCSFCGGRKGRRLVPRAIRRRRWRRWRHRLWSLFGDQDRE